MDIMEAIEKRISCRAFDSRIVETEKCDALKREIERVNSESGMHFQFYGPRDDGTALDMSPKMFASNPPCYAALVAPAGALNQEMLGYYGEKIVLLATQLGLSSCWVASTFDRSTTRVECAPDEMLHDVIPIGYAPEKMPLKQWTIRKGLRARSKKPASMWKSATPIEEAPEWIRAGIEAVGLAPSAINEQPVLIIQDEDGGQLHAELVRVRTGQEYTDLGIAKLHFQLAAQAHGVVGTWEWGVGGAFILS